MTLQPSTKNFSLINYSQEKDLNNLVAARKHQKNPEKDLNNLVAARKHQKNPEKDFKVVFVWFDIPGKSKRTKNC